LRPWKRRPGQRTNIIPKIALVASGVMHGGSWTPGSDASRRQSTGITDTSDLRAAPGFSAPLSLSYSVATEQSISHDLSVALRIRYRNPDRLH